MQPSFPIRRVVARVGIRASVGLLLATAACDDGPVSDGVQGVCLAVPDPMEECPSAERASEILGRRDLVGLRERFEAHEYRVDGDVYEQPAQCCYDTALSTGIESEEEEPGS